ncbi:GH36-type glycosyl hydrolase domain-containing protein [Ideonella sp.]|uniref:GH36-type glycosyl hydrolase domain-containing protein n=1 Tax=Ideonella sp. TaxID=1929293 RepID=UPI002B498146|nr:glucoamylase family protein [Ideonella sp.]HJV70164.1 glucoamylase family protein [Ideonella sp.]
MNPGSPLRREAQHFIDPRRGPLPAPVRSVLFGLERFRQHGISLAQAQPVERRRAWRRRVRAPRFFPRLESNVRMLERTRRYLELLEHEGDALSPAAEWLLDNFHLIEAQLPDIRSGMPRGYYAQLPKLRTPPLAGLPRVYGIAWAYVAHTDANFDAALLAHFLKAYQEIDQLTLGELWALPSTLRVVLLENLGRLAEDVATAKAAREAANWCCDRESTLPLAQLDAMFQRVDERGVRLVFLSQLVQRLRSQEPPGPGAEPSRFAAWLDDKVHDPSALLAAAQEAQAADNVSVGNAVTALRKINNLDWVELVAQVSPVLQVLARAPAFLADSELTRDQTTHAIERLARRLRRPELEVARKVLQLCEADAADPSHGPAHWTIGAGRQALVAMLGAPAEAAEEAVTQWWGRWRTTLYGTTLAMGAAALLAWLLQGQQPLGALGVAALVLMVIPVLECVVALVHRVLTEAVRVQRLPRLALDDGLLPGHRTLVVVPCLLSSAATVESLVDRLTQHHLANPEAETSFVLLSDWVDARAATLAEDAPLLDAARAGIERLNRQYAGPDAGPRFLLLHRQRSWSESEGVWMGWERKRGKIEQLLALLAADGDDPSPFVDLGLLSRPPIGVRYAVVLDADTELPPGALREMVAIAAHPLNHPRIDERSRRVVSGYGILQPRVAMPFPAASEITAYGWLFAAPWGTDAYNGGSSEVYQDVFGEGSFVGKGLFDVHAVHDVLEGRVAPGKLLSHDLFEGLWARCAFLSDVVVLESHPMHPEVAASRVHRWTRGDWQLLAFLGAVLRGGVGAVNVWKVLDNLRRSLLAPACVALLWLAFTTGVVGPGVAVALVLAAYGLGPMVGAVAGLAPGRGHLAWGHLAREAGRELGRAAAGALWHIATLLYAAALQLDAIVRALWRMAVSRHGLLQWTTAAQAQALSRRDLAGFCRRHAGVTLTAVAWVALGWMVPGAARGWLLGAGLLWAATPLWLWASAQPLRRAPRDALSGADREYLLGVARDTWSYFADCVTAEDHELPPDNLQLEPQPMLARRTSPTNIGFYLLSALCARRFGFIDVAELGARVDRTLATLERLPRHRGHFYNWIDTETLQTLPPAYVSAVDSGNLAGALWALAQACREEGGQAWAERAARADALAGAMDFRFLYDRKRRLFHIGYRHDDATLDPAYYDLLASESRLTSFVAIAKGDVSRRHWESLGRPFVACRGDPALRSWSGSMFEYLMPALLMEEPSGGLLRRMERVAVQAQRAFGERHGVPWGVSECAYFAQDHTLAFQYSPFGVPALALRRTPPEDRVIAPYATALALLVDPPAALANLRSIERHGGRERHGFIEALDFSRSRAGEGGAPQRVATFMAHHQGMSLVALTDLLCDGAPRGWFGRAPLVRAHARLLHERMPREIVLQEPILSREPPPPAEEAATVVREFGLAMPLALPPTHWLGNGSYSVALRPNGAGQSRWRGHAISRARDDLLRDAYGSWLMLRCPGRAAFESLTQAPCPRPGASYLTRFFADHVEFHRRCDAFEAETAVWVSADEDVEFRQVTLHNLSDASVTVELVSWFEAALSPQAADESHPAFANLFVQAHALDPRAALLERRPRLPGEQGLWVAHFLGACDVEPEAVAVCCDREALLPRGGRLDQLHGGPPTRPLADGRLDTGLDPVASLTVCVSIAPRARTTLTFATAAAPDADTLLSWMDEYRQDVHVARSRRMAAALARIRQRELRLVAADLHATQDMATLVVMNRSHRRAPPALALDRRALWRFGVSGDRPIIVARIGAAQGLPAVRALLAALRLWELAGLAIDLVIVNGEPASYLMPLQDQIASLRHSLDGGRIVQPERGSVVVLRQPDISPAEAAALHAVARLDLVTDGRPLPRLLALATADETASRLASAPRRPAPWPDALAPSRLADGGRRFEIDIDAAHVTPRPWANVIANKDFGCLVTESGGGFTWAGNSRMNQLTPWSNDPLLDPPGEHFLLQDTTHGVGAAPWFGALPTLDRNGSAGYRVRHTQGVSEFTHERQRLSVQARLAVHPTEAVKCLHLRLGNLGGETRRLRLLGLVEWVLGAQRRERMTLATEYVHDAQAVLARQLEHQGGFGEGAAFLMLHGLPVQRWTCARSEFFDAHGGLDVAERLQGASGFGLDPCGALDAVATLAVGQHIDVYWVIGYAPGREAALALARRMAVPGALAGLADQAAAAWDERLGAIQVHTPDPLFDAMVNRWWLYQSVGCRMWAKAGFYQVSGATGFRDQLQDALALAWGEPAALREQILLHATRQFPEGDVQHWWHAPTGAGVRTHFSDDLLWLPFAVQHHLASLGDGGLLDTELPFLDGPPVPEGAEDAYYVPSTSAQTATLYEHAARAIDHALRFGAHGLPLMGSGDWNDGMNRVGHGGQGESVWVGWFLLAILPPWQRLAEARGDHQRAGHWAASEAALERAMRDSAWDGEWFRRAYFDNGQPLGSQLNTECRIDLIAQAWAVFVRPPGDAQAAQAMAAADAQLVDRTHGLIRLLDPPLQRSEDHAGYIQSYPPGVRENGGQYSHAAAWALIAQARLGHEAKVAEYLAMLSPAHRARSEAEQRRYRLEPYVMPGDIYAAPPYEGRGGWSWYSGSAAWIWRAAVEAILGLEQRPGGLRVSPCLPPDWPQARVDLRIQGRRLQVLLQRAPVLPGGVLPLQRGTWVELASLADGVTLGVLVPAGADQPVGALGTPIGAVGR